MYHARDTDLEGLLKRSSIFRENGQEYKIIGKREIRIKFRRKFSFSKIDILYLLKLYNINDTNYTYNRMLSHLKVLHKNIKSQ